MAQLLCNESFLNFAMKHYDNPQCKTIDEFQEDLNRFKYIKKLINRHANDEDIDYRLLLNHVVILSNVFDKSAFVYMLFNQTPIIYWNVIKTLLLQLNLMPEEIPELGIINTNIAVDQKIAEYLRTI
jgi:hypothetical protein